MNLVEFLITLFTIALFVGVVFFSDGISPADKELSTTEIESACAADLQCWGNRAIAVGAWQCKQNIEKEAVMDIRWTDSFGRPTFMQLAWHRKGAKTITVFGDELLFQNRFGAYIRMTYSCVIDVYGQKVLSHDVQEGRLLEIKAKPPNLN